MKKNKVIVLILALSTIFALLVLAILITNKPVDPIAFYYLGSTNLVDGSIMVSCVISNKSRGDIIVENNVRVFQKGEESDATSLLIHTSFQSLPGINRYRHISPGGIQPFVFKLPPISEGQPPSHLDTNNFKLGVQWTWGFRYEIAEVLEKLNMRWLKNWLPEMQPSGSEWITVSKTDAFTQHEGED